MSSIGRGSLPLPWAVIARRIGRHPTTVMGEVVANGGRGRYRPAVAERRADAKRCRPRPRRLVVARARRDPGDPNPLPFL